MDLKGGVIMADLRMGLGYDRHRLEEGIKLMVGGVEVPYDRGLAGHSDGDLLCHVIMDALLGAANLGEVGTLFPNTDPAYKDVNSLSLLEEIGEKLKRVRCKVLNIDCVIVAQQPKLSTYYSQMKRNVAGALGILPQQVGIKAKTGEELGWVGAGHGMEAMCTALLEIGE